jgi:hypothetical protein
MKDVIIITCYQFDVTRKLIRLLGRDNCYLVVDNRPEDFKLFKDNFGDRIISSGPFGYYTSDEALGRLRMMKNIMEVTKGDFDRLHIISQNDLPTMGWLNRKNIVEPDKEYIHINKSGWTSNYMTVTPKLCDYLNSHESEVINYIEKVFWHGDSNMVGALSENIWSKLLIDYPNRVNSDLRLYTYWDDPIYEYKGKQLGHFTKNSSPLTLKKSKATLDCLSRYDWYLFARKFDFNSDIYNYWYNQMEKLLC